MNDSSAASCKAPGAEDDAYVRLLNFYVLLTVNGAGIVANVIIIVVFSKKRRLSSTDFLAGALAFYDVLVVTAKSLYAHRYAYPYVFGDDGNSAAASKVALVALCVDRVVHVCNTYTIVFLSLDRYIRVCHSARAKRWCTYSMAKKVQAALLAASVLYSAPAIYMFAEVLAAADTGAVRSCYGVFQFPAGFLGVNEAFGYGYDFVMYVIVFYLVPLLTLSFSNVNLIKTVVERKRFAMRAGRMTPQHSGKSSEGLTEISTVGNRVIATLILVTAIFFFSQLPALADQIYSFSYFNEGSLLHVISYDFILVNCSINCAIYTLSSKTFRKRLCHLMGLAPTESQESSKSRYFCWNDGSKYVQEAASVFQTVPSSATPV